MPRTNWKQDRKKRREFILWALKNTRARPKKIAAKAEVHQSTVTYYNKKFRVRSKQTAREIDIEERMKKQMHKKRVRAFSVEQKQDLINKNKAKTQSGLKKLWQNGSVNKYFKGNFSAFLRDANRFIFEELDYYDPVFSQEGEKITPASWIQLTVRLFGLIVLEKNRK